ncbi:LytR/AlgR family response regulator transcription factor [Lysinibacillus antri]|uniref:Response regulator transcription factor n=1 Tax=Lysinibacillus antri TaxID=2498145 RepID=A0A3S0P687_9BACI|nr:LytTR family DNA-binding domain-containing protein [Lysinibacillus antri]RUL48622.1 response regulator transcription factor [Lysinibacillus antri]
MERIKIIVAEDHPDSLEIIEAFIERHPSFDVIATCTDGEELIHQVTIYDPKLIIADINMPKLNGMEAVKKCKKVKPDIKVIFITGYDEFAVEAFAESAVDYIVKPIDSARLYQALEKVKSSLAYQTNEKNYQGTKKLKIKTNGVLHLIPMDDIYFVEKQGKKCIIHLSGRTIETNENLTELSKRLDSNFFVAHRSNIVNINKISSIVQDYETFLAYFDGLEKAAHVSKLKIKELEEKISGN